MVRLFIMDILVEIKMHGCYSCCVCVVKFLKDVRQQNLKHFTSPERNAALTDPETVWLLRQI